MFIFRRNKKNEPKVELSEGALKLGFTSKTAEPALKNAIENRKIELDLYWRRAAYFWVFIGLTWGAVGKIVFDMKFGDPVRNFNLVQSFILFGVVCIGFCLSLSWYFMNRGSKFWIENWEHQIYQLEGSIIGPSYATNISKVRSERSFHVFPYLLGPARYSVSKINLLISLFNMILWFSIMLASLFFIIVTFFCEIQCEDIATIGIVLGIFVLMIMTVVYTICIKYHCKSDLGMENKDVYFITKKTGFLKQDGEE